MQNMHGFLIGRITLLFGGNDEDDVLRGELSASALDTHGFLWVASDELAGVSRLQPHQRGVFDSQRFFNLAGAFALPNGEEEIDIEGMDCADGHLWLTGSHTSTRKKVKPGKSEHKNLQRLARVERNPNRFVIGRVCIGNGALVAEATPARLSTTVTGNALTDALQDDPHLGPFLRIPRAEGESVQLATKENGFDIEGLAVRGSRVFLGLRGPVLRGWALLLEIEPVETGSAELTLGPIGPHGRAYRKHFVELAGRGIRDLLWQGEDLLILAGPTMDIPGLQTLYQLRGTGELDSDSITAVDAGRLTRLFDLAAPREGDKAEGLARYDGLGEPGLLVVYDSPRAERLVGEAGVLADVFRVPEN